jgi:VanZ family protein
MNDYRNREIDVVSNMTFSALLREAYQLYQAERYAQALDLLTRESGRFPGYGQRFSG